MWSGVRLRRDEMAGKQGKGARARAKLRRLREKRARRQSMQSQYERWRDEGRNRKDKSKRAKKAKRVLARNVSHPLGPCGNPGCTRCHGVRFKPFLQGLVPVGMPQWMWLRWNKLGRAEQRLAAA